MTSYAPNVQPGDRVVLYDGVCKLCSAWARFLIRFDRSCVFKLAPIQSPEGTAILSFYGMPTDRFDTLVLVDDLDIRTKSSAILDIVGRLPFPWPLLTIARVVPRFIRDWIYDRVARSRYKLFGRYDACMLPAPDHDRRFLRASR